MRNLQFRWWALTVLAVLTVAAIGGSVARANDPSSPPPSKYAPADDLVTYLRQLLKRMGSDLSDAEDYGEEEQQRVTMRAYTVVAIALVLECHDSPHPLKSVARRLIESATQLADHAGDFEKAKAAYDRLSELAAQDHDSSGKRGEWEPVADIAELMKAVPIINNQMRRGIQSRRFAHSAERTAVYAAALAAVAQASLVDDSYCGDEEDFAKWQKLCAEMRDGAAAAARAVRAGDQEEAKRQAANIVKTCDACHEDFR